MKSDFLNSMSRAFNKVGFQIKKHSPEILLVAGVAGGVASAVMACKATTKLEKVLEENKKNVQQLHEYVETHGYSEAYTEQDGKKDLAIMYTKTGLDLAKLYGPAVLLGAASIGCLFASNNIMRKRNVALAAAYATVETGFKKYRGRVIERFGEELDRELKYDLRKEEVEETVVDEKGKEKTVKKIETVVDSKNAFLASPYAKFFDEYCTRWEKNAEINLMTLRTQQNYANDKLRSQGHLFLNEVYDMLGIPRTKMGQVVGWVYKKDDDHADGYVDFGIYDTRNREAVNGYERTFLLDFNVDGNIYDLMQ